MDRRLEFDSLRLLWLAVLVAAVLTLSFLSSIEPNDYWWYLRIGADIWREGSIPTVDTLSYTRAGEPFVYHSWLSAVLLYLAHSLGGVTLTLVARGVLLSLFFGLIWQLCRFQGAGPRIATTLTFITALISVGNWGARPQTLVLPLFALSLFVLMRWQRGEYRFLWLLPLMMVGWVNLHGSFVLLLLVIGAALVGGGGDRRALAIALLATIAATLVNPRLLGAWSYVLTLLSDSSSQTYSIEWRPPSASGLDGKLFFGWLLLMLPLMAYSPARPSRVEWLWLLGFGWMALSGHRYVIWFLVILAPVTAGLLAPMVIGRGAAPRRSRRINYVIAGVLVAMTFLFLPGSRERIMSEAPPPLSDNNPLDATRWLAARPELLGALWSDIAYSSYLTFALPERPVWADTRFELYPPEQWQAYITISEAVPGWDEVLDEDEINLLMLHPRAQQRLITALEEEAAWCRLYTSAEGAVIVARREGETPCPVEEVHESQREEASAARGQDE